MGGYASATLPSWPLKPEMKTSSFKTPVYELPYVENDIRCYITLGDQIMQHFADLNKVYEWLMTLDFVCYIDIHAISYRSMQILFYLFHLASKVRRK